MADPVRTEVVDGVLVVTLDRPTANAIDVDDQPGVVRRVRAARGRPRPARRAS